MTTKKKTKILLILDSLIFGLWLPFAFLMLPFIVFLYDDPAAAGDILLLLLTILWVAYPFVIIVSILGSWLFYKKERFTPAMWFSVLPWINIALFILVGIFFFEA